MLEKDKVHKEAGVNVLDALVGESKASAKRRLGFEAIKNAFKLNKDLSTKNLSFTKVRIRSSIFTYLFKYELKSALNASSYSRKVYKYYKRLKEEKTRVLDYDAVIEKRQRKMLVELVGCFIVKIYTEEKRKCGICIRKRERYPPRSMRISAYDCLLKLFRGMSH